MKSSVLHEPLCPEDGPNYLEMLIEMTGQKTVPSIFINKTHFGDCSKTMQVRNKCVSVNEQDCHTSL